jgi:hypothetical protein
LFRTFLSDYTQDYPETCLSFHTFHTETCLSFHTLKITPRRACPFTQTCLSFHTVLSHRPFTPFTPSFHTTCWANSPSRLKIFGPHSKKPRSCTTKPSKSEINSSKSCAAKSSSIAAMASAQGGNGSPMLRDRAGCSNPMRSMASPFAVPRRPRLVRGHPIQIPRLSDRQANDGRRRLPGLRFSHFACADCCDVQRPSSSRPATGGGQGDTSPSASGRPLLSHGGPNRPSTFVR